MMLGESYDPSFIQGPDLYDCYSFAYKDLFLSFWGKFV